MVEVGTHLGAHCLCSLVVKARLRSAVDRSRPATSSLCFPSTSAIAVRHPELTGVDATATSPIGFTGAAGMLPLSPPFKKKKKKSSDFARSASGSKSSHRNAQLVVQAWTGLAKEINHLWGVRTFSQVITRLSRTPNDHALSSSAVQERP